jgi:hypothetical protein
MVTVHLEGCSDEIYDGFLQFKESVRTVIVNCASRCSPQIIIRGVRLGNCGGQMPFEIILFPNTSHSSVMET